MKENTEKYISISDFDPDDSFFDELGEGGFVLVLGAGFSFGIKNLIEPNDVEELNNELERIGRNNLLQFDLCKTIPLGKDFVAISNIIYETGFDPKTDYRLAANQWSGFKLNGDFDLSVFFRKLFTANKRDIEDKIELLESIFVPNWHNIYTLNFDNVLEEILSIRNLTHKYKTYSYPEEPGFETRAPLPIIAHLHGTIQTNDLNNLVFSDDSYTKIRGSQQSLYDNLHAEIKSGKKILIAGTQFNDSVIDDKLTHDISDFVFYHFDTDHKSIEGKKFAKNRSTSKYITLYRDQDNLGTNLFLQFLQENKDKIERIQIDGAEVINRAFIERIKTEGTEKNYQPADFYFAKQIDSCQWYGIEKNWDAKRAEYVDIRREIFKSFASPDEPKVTAIILGRGGSGKSTLLRRLAYDLSREKFAVIWVNDKEINTFSDQGIDQLGNYPQKQFLVIIEDWYRIKQNIKEKTASVIKSLCDYPNARILIGDRTLDAFVKSFLNNPDKNQFKLKASDNHILLPQILDRIKVWKSTAKELLKTSDDYKSSLYLILWTIGRTYILKERKVQGFIQHEKLKSHFQSIVLSDLKAIYKTAPGFARALYYWANVYSAIKVYITFNIFELIAKFFTQDEKIFNGYYSVDRETKELLDIYINHSQSTFKSAIDLSLIAFNHDILAEEGLVKSDFDKVEVREMLICEPFSDGIKNQILNIIINEGDGFSASNFLYYYLSTIHPKAIPTNKKLEYIETQYNKGNRGSYLNHIFYKNDITETKTKIEYAKKIINDYSTNHYENSTICLCLQNLKETKDKGEIESKSLINKFLNEENIPYQIICNCLQNLKETKNKGETESKALIKSYMDGKDMFHAIISNCLQNLKETKNKGETESKALIKSYMDGKDVGHAIISNCLQNLKETKDKGETESKALIKCFMDGKEVAIEIISNCLQNLKEIKDKGETESKALIKSYMHGKDMGHAIISNCLQNLKETNDKGETESKALIKCYIDGKEMGHAIISNCLQNLKETNDKGEAESKALIKNYIDGKVVRYEIISNCLQNLKETNDKGEAESNVLINRFIGGKDMFHPIISNCLQNLKETKDKGETESKALIKMYIEGKEVGNEIVCNCLQLLNDTDTGKYYATIFLKDKDWKKEHWGIVYQSLSCFKRDLNPPEFVVKIVNKIIDDNSKKCDREKGSYFFYKNLMKIPFHSIQQWRNENNANIGKWYSLKRDLVVSTIIANLNFPDEIQNMCADILTNWKVEILIPIPTLKKDEEHKGDHIKLALGNPNLQSFAFFIAKEMAEVENKNPKTLPDYLLKVVLKIVQENPEYPEWKTITENEIDTE